MKSKVFAAMTITLGIAAAMAHDAAQAQHVTVRVDAPGFGIRIGHPGYLHPPVLVAPVVRYPAPILYPFPYYVPPRVIHAPPPVVIHPHRGHGYRHGYQHHPGHHGGHPHDGHRGHDRGDGDRHGSHGHEGRVIRNVQLRTH